VAATCYAIYLSVLMYAFKHVFFWNTTYSCQKKLKNDQTLTAKTHHKSKCAHVCLLYVFFLIPHIDVKKIEKWPNFDSQNPPYIQVCSCVSFTCLFFNTTYWCKKKLKNDQTLTAKTHHISKRAHVGLLEDNIREITMLPKRDKWYISNINGVKLLSRKRQEK